MASILSLLPTWGMVVLQSFLVPPFSADALCSSPWLLSPTFLWHSYSSRSWFCLVRHSTAAARVCTCLARATVHGSSSVWLLVAIERVSTIQLFVWEMVIWLLLFYSLNFPTDGANRWCQKSLVSRTVLMCSRQNLWNKNKEDIAESTDVIPIKYPPKVKLENFYNSRVLELG